MMYPQKDGKKENTMAGGIPFLSRVSRPVFRLLVAVLCVAGTTLDARSEILTLKDKLGHQVAVSVPVRRAVFLSLYEFIPVLGVGDKVVGVNRWAFDHSTLEPTLKQRGIPSVGTGSNVNVERILALEPDLVILWSYKPEMVEFLAARGLKVLAVYPDSLEELYEVMDLCGRLFGVEGRAKEVRSLMEGMFEMIRSPVSRVTFEQRRKVLWVWQEPTRVSGSLGLQQDLTGWIGAVNPAGGFPTRYANVSLEQIVAWNPDVIFIWGHATYGAERLLESPQWKSVRAVRDGRVFKAPKVDSWSPSVALLALWMAQKTYPECFSGMSLHPMARTFHMQCFGVPLDGPLDQEAQWRND